MKDTFGIGFEEIGVKKIVLWLFFEPRGGLQVYLQLFIFEFEWLIFGSINKRDKIFEMCPFLKGVFDCFQRPSFDSISVIHAYIITSFNLHHD